MMWGSNKNRRQKVFNRGALHLRRGTWHSENLIKSLICSVSYLNLRGWGLRTTHLRRIRTTNLRHKTQTRFCNFLSVSYFLSLWGRVLWLPIDKLTFACYSRSPISLIFLAWEQKKLAQVLNNNLISEWLSKRKLKWKETHLEIPIALLLLEMMTKLVHLFRRSNYV